MATKKPTRNTVSRMNKEDLTNYTTILMFQAHVASLALEAFPHPVATHAYNLCVTTLDQAIEACKTKGINIMQIEEFVQDALNSGLPSMVATREAPVEAEANVEKEQE